MKTAFTKPMIAVNIKYIKASKKLRTESGSGQPLSRSWLLLPRHTLLWILSWGTLNWTLATSPRDSKQPSPASRSNWGTPLTRKHEGSSTLQSRHKLARGVWVGGGPPQDARKTRALGLRVRSGPGVRQGLPRRCGGAPSPWTATTPGPLGLPPCSQLRSQPPGPKPPGPGSTARHSARAPSPGRCGRSPWARGFWGARSRCRPPPPPGPGPRPRPQPAPGAAPATVPWRDDHEPRRRRRREKRTAAGSRWGRGGPASVPAHFGRLSAPSGRSPRVWPGRRPRTGLDCERRTSHLR